MSKQEEVSDSLGMHLWDTTTGELSPETHINFYLKSHSSAVCLHFPICLEWMLSWHQPPSSKRFESHKSTPADDEWSWDQTNTASPSDHRKWGGKINPSKNHPQIVWFHNTWLSNQLFVTIEHFKVKLDIVIISMCVNLHGVVFTAIRLFHFLSSLYVSMHKCVLVYVRWNKWAFSLNACVCKWVWKAM